MDKYCSNCGEPIHGNFCSNCGKPVKSNVGNNHITNPVNVSGIKSNKKGSGCLKFFLVGFLCFVTISIISSILNINKNPNLSTNNSKQTEFQKITETTPEQADAILNILKQCGVDNITSIVPDEMLNDMHEEGEKGYRLSANGINNIILYLKSDKTVNKVRYADNELYSNGTIHSTLKDYTFTLDEKSNLKTSCQEAIKSILKSPSTAKFPNITEWKFAKQNGQIIIQSYVDSQNSFGAELRSQFQFILDANDYTIKSLIFDGKEMINNN